jgi:hypothetical protein
MLSSVAVSAVCTSPPSDAGMEGDADDEAVCRICREPGTDESPLRFPCACSGSIKHVHQDCLLEWLKVGTPGPPPVSTAIHPPHTPSASHEAQGWTLRTGGRERDRLPRCSRASTCDVVHTAHSLNAPATSEDATAFPGDDLSWKSRLQTPCRQGARAAADATRR